ncbi:helix-turn-helix transcriptional regulator [Rhodopseudomonas palustris]|uniref:helix-turn-helix transcriptional regulator n=1 Tax=Rhodopseudomonas palustris TaxID=1076 RepID=UPI000E5A5538|nr:AraC family transcriptional regulator [Rhodopseudomonas palustris]QLH72851.1 helix-turn-helix transcriptional regulator [Rhodopseudomonas palustris]RHZ99912.1 AraC family transcriptional regulator [Rhodopseudomonas palustris]
MTLEHRWTGAISRLDLAGGVLQQPDGDWVDEQLHHGTKVVVILRGAMRAQIDGCGSEFSIAGPTVCVIRAPADASGRQMITADEPLHYVMVKAAFEPGSEADRERDPLAPLFCTDRPSLQHIEAPRALQALCTQLEVCPFVGAARDLFLSAKAIEILALACDAVETNIATETLRPSLGDVERLKKARAILLERLGAPPNLPALAAAVGMNTRKLTDGFQAAFGTTVNDFLQDARLNEAYRLLSSGATNVSEAAHRVGYTPAYFSAVFRKRFGISPRDLL